MPTYGGKNKDNRSPENYVYANAGQNPLVNTNFMMRVEGFFDVPCKKINAFKKENEFQQVQEGGCNDYVHMRRKSITKPFTFSVERYTGYDWVDPLPLGVELVLPIVIFVSRYPGLFVPGMVARVYTFTGCTVIGKTWGELNAEQTGLLTETIEIAYREFVVVNIPVALQVEDKEAIKPKPQAPPVPSV